MTPEEWDKFSFEFAQTVLAKAGIYHPPASSLPVAVAAAIRTAIDVGRRDERARAAKIVEQRRLQILANPDDPSWTEHFAELQTIIRAGNS